MTPERLFLGGAPTVGFGQIEAMAPAIPPSSPFTIALATSVMGAAAGWVIEEVALAVRGKRKR